MPEIAGDAAAIIDPFKYMEITEALENLTTNQDLRTQLINKGLERSKLFTWKRMAEEVLLIYSEIGNNIKN
jgi:glycosyltransferase involved in cell wall biosynthesis